MMPTVRSYSPPGQRTSATRAGCLLICCLPLLYSQTTTSDKPEPVKTSITVSESITAETPANITVMTGPSLAAEPGVNIDDKLRQEPGFTLFRRNSSVVANPTTQGVSLRGLTASGASRTLVLEDSVPVNDPFGGWLYWTRFIPEELDRVEISRGAATSLYGDLAMGGAISLFDREPGKTRYWGSYNGGSENTQDLSGGFSTVWKQWGFSTNVRGVTTDGNYVVPTTIRGAVDRKANVRFATGDVRLDWLGNGQKFFVRLDILGEERGNGTYLTNNSTGLGTLSGHYLKQWTKDGLSLVAFHSREQFHASYTSVTNNRNTEKLSYLQTVPAQSAGGSAVWNHSETWWNLLAGGDVNKTQGTSTDHLTPTTLRIGGGNEFFHGEFVQADAHFRDWRFFAGARHQFTVGDHQFFSPSAGLVYGKGQWRLRGSVYRAFRAPTLNELYREFKSGNTDTLPNGNLQPETIFGSEAGVDWTGETSSLRVTAFRNQLDHVITNVTLSSTAALILRQRQNAAAAVGKGFEATAQKRYKELKGRASYLYVQSRFDTGLLLPQVPRHQGSAELSWSHKNTMAMASMRTYSSQFDDDKNTFLLPGFATAGLMVEQKLNPHLAASLTVENVLDRLYYTGFTPNATIGSPRQVRAGLKWITQR